MFPYSVGVLTMLQGFYSLLWIVILMDISSPSFDLRRLPEWSGAQVGLVLSGLFTTAFAVGLVMHTLSRDLFRRYKDRWAQYVLTSPSITGRLNDLESCRPTGGPALSEVLAAEGAQGVRKAGEFIHAVEYEIMTRAPHLYRSIQVYRDQYRLARGAILPSLALGLVLPFWEPIPAGHVSPFPLIGFQGFFLGIFCAGVSMHAFRERSYRYAAARLRGFLILQSDARRVSQAATGHLAAVS